MGAVVQRRAPHPPHDPRRSRSLRSGRGSALLTALVLLAAGCGADGLVDDGAPAEDVASAPQMDEPAPDPALDPDPEPERDQDPRPDEAAELEPDVEVEHVETSSSVDGELAVHYLDVGQGDATLLVHDDVSILIDTGRWQASDVVPMLAARDVDALDLLVITHPHADHIGQFDQVMAGIDVAEVWWSGSETTTQTFDRALTALETSDALYEEPRAGDTTSIGPLDIDIVNPPVGTDLTDLHDAGLAMRVTYGEVRFLFTGDAESSTEARMVARSSTLAADVLQLGHHGSDTSTTAGFLDVVSPSVAISSAGAGNPYGHPHRSVIDRLTAAGIATYGTDVHGSITVTTDGATWSIRTERDGTVGPGSAGTSSDADAESSGAVGESTDQSGSTAPSSGACSTAQVDINSAGLDEVQGIIHIGPARAEDLLSSRPFTSVRELVRISGIGPARLDDIIAQGVACVG